MSDAVTVTRQGPLTLIAVNNPPVNALSHAVRSGIADGLSQAAEDDSEAVIIYCEGRTFIAGADITEFGKPPQAPWLPDLLVQLDSHPKLTIAALHGTALGGGFELALTCNYRIALDTARVGLPEVKLGLLPGAGGTQRTPRLAGIAAAVDLITVGNPIKAEEAVALQLVDRVVTDNLLEGAVAYAHELIVNNAAQRQASALPLTLGDAERELIAQARTRLEKKTRGETAPQRILDCLEAAGELPFADGLAREREEFSACMA
ncbi:MAG: enoyl-CoA hydratase/isomerase family protein, partial [Cellvibrionales bacterium]